MLEKNRNLLIAAAVEMYKSGKISLGRAAEIAGMSLPDFKDALKERGIHIVLRHDRKMMKDADRIMKKMKYPLHFLDFETYSLPIPLFDGTRPYQQIPFQFSLHIQRTETAEPEHYSFLAEGDGQDPRRQLLNKLKQAVMDSGSIMSYNASFEKGVLKELANTFPEFDDWIASVLPRFADLLMPFRNFHYYHPDQEGSASIKKVLPALTGRAYDDMDISKGGNASALFLLISMGKLGNTEVQKIRSDLEKYCFLDTEAMVLILEELEKAAGKKDIEVGA